MNVLLVAFGFPPSRASGIYRPMAMARVLASLGHEVTVMTADEEFFRVSTGVDDSLASTLPPLSVIRVPYSDPRDPIVSRWPEGRAKAPARWLREADAARSAMFPEPYGPWRDRIVAAAVRAHASHPFDMAIATGNPYVSYAVLSALDVLHAIPYVMDDRDSFLFSVFTAEPAEDFEARVAWWLPLAGRARAVWFVNEPIADLYRTAFPSLRQRIGVVPNGFDPDYLRAGELGRVAHEPPVFSYIGTVNRDFPLAPIIEGWRAVRGSGIPAESILRLVGSMGYRRQSAEQADLLRDAGIDGVEVRGHLPKAEIQSAYAESDVLVFSREGGALVTSGKVYEYVATGLPIAAVVPREHDSRRILEGYPRAHVLSPDDAGAWPRVLQAALDDARSADVARIRAAQDYGAGYSRAEVLKGVLEATLSTVRETS